MDFDFGDVLSRAWQITWKHRVLWIIGTVMGFFVSLMFPLMFSPILFPVLMQNSNIDAKAVLAYIVVFMVVFLLFMLALYPISVLTQTSITLGVLNANKENNESLSARDLIKRGLPFFWRVLGLMLLFAVGMTLIVFMFQAVVLLLTVVTLGLAMFCMMPFTLLLYPLMFGSTVWMEQAMNGIIIDNMTVTEAAKQGWDLLRNNLMPFTLIALVVYFGIGFISGALMMPMMVPFFLVPFSLIEHQTHWPILSVSLLWVLGFIPIFVFITAFSAVFTKSIWVLTYLRLTHRPTLQPLLQETTS